MRRLAVVPARGGSKRIPDKNVRDFCGKPMIAHVLSAAKDSGLFDKIHVSTDSERILEAVKALGFPADFPRDASLAGDHTPLFPVLEWVLKEYGRRDESFDEVCLLLPCAPLIEAQDLLAACRVFRENGGERPLISVAEFPVPVEWAFRRDERGRLTPLQPGKFAVRSQDLEKAYYDAGAFIFFPARRIASGEPLTDTDYVSYILPKAKAVDIDGEEDWKLAEALYRGRTG